MAFYILIILLLVIVALFTSPRLSPVPYFPSNKEDLDLIIKALKLRKDQVVVDLGAGDGAVIFSAATEAQKRHLNTVFVALEINPVLVLILLYRKFLHANRRSIKIVWGDLFKSDYADMTAKAKHKTFFLYLSPWLLEAVLKAIQKGVRRFEVVSYFYSLPKPRGYKLVKTTKNVHAVYQYN